MDSLLQKNLSGIIASCVLPHRHETPHISLPAKPPHVRNAPTKCKRATSPSCPFVPSRLRVYPPAPRLLMGSRVQQQPSMHARHIPHIPLIRKLLPRHHNMLARRTRPTPP